MGSKFDAKLDDAIDVAEKYSGFSKFHDSYRPLFKKIWKSLDPQETGSISFAQAKVFAQKMVDAGWADWEPSKRDLEVWKELEETFGDIGLEYFAEASENSDFRVPKAKPKRTGKAEAGARMAKAHHERMEGFKLPDTTTKASQMSPGHCTECEHQPMCQHPYCGSCSFCKDDSARKGPPRLGEGSTLLDYMCMCNGCAKKMNRCCGCGAKLK
uniref:EF-hand domain-containing protein n=1 Tax=Chromera velia CCMP2878 TaxID=1169474 RepID=A0A0G4HQ25_9ALVE|eukprot:Cvel_1239.t1-p1 / transcript=Cvel_1239.t1 / gene=Cvel_1239 / organism=Chromera_velia_CCMP2878 / gene_product=hypothetical protein / transcript_product=hypothetical protein / location=Cvel_scaffold41:103448-104083(-) / protein_length=212 / sequence_SO=supercontig / SO=protein_coding / is_pseudo=false